SLHGKHDWLLPVAGVTALPHTDGMRSWRTLVWPLAAGFWTLFGVISGMQVWLSMITHGHSLPRGIAYQVLVWSAWLPLSWAIVGAARRWPLAPPRALHILLHLLLACVFSTLHAAWWGELN